MKKFYPDLLLRSALLMIAFILSGLTINVLAQGETEVEPAADPCDIEVQCGFEAINNYFIQMGYMPYSGPYPDPPQGGCGMDNPNWFAFVAGGYTVTLVIDVKNCTQGSSGPGVQLTIYEGDPTCVINGSNLSVTGLNSIAGRCNPPMDMGSYTYTFNTIPGYTYYMLLDGWGSSLCEVVVRIEQGGEPPALDQTIFPEEVNLPEFEGPDTLCLGAIEYTFCAEDLPVGAAYTLWVLPDGDTVRSEIGNPCVTLTDVFDSEGEFELCVAAASDCDQTDYACRTYFVKPLKIQREEDEICEREDYYWEHDDIDASNLAPGVHEFFGYSEASTGGCLQEHQLTLTVTPTNWDDPTERDSIICLNDSYFFDVNLSTPEHFFTDLPITDAEYIDKSPKSGCDTFFNITVEVIGGEFIIMPPTCNGIGQIVFGFDFFEVIANTIPLNDPRLTVVYEWFIGGDKVGEDEMLYLTQDDLEYYGASGSFGVRLQVTIYWDNFQHFCTFTSDVFNVNVDEWIPQINGVEGPETLCQGSEGAYTIDIDFTPFMNDDIIMNIVVYAPTNVFADVDILNHSFTLYPMPGGQSGQVCVWLTTFCGFEAEYCFDIEIIDIDDPDAGEDREECEPTFALSASPGEDGNWSTGSTPAGSTVDYEDKNSANTNVTVDRYGKYTFVWTEGIPGCQKQDSVVIEYVRGPQMDGNVSYNCNAGQTAYTVTFSVTGGTLPYQVTSNNGSFDNGVFTSEEFDSESEHTITIVDANGCGPLEVQVTFTCDCDNDAGTMASEVIELCADGIAQGVYNGDGELRPEDAEEFVLHSGSGSVLGTIYGRNSTGEFSFQAGMTYGTTYYISHMVGLASNGEVDLDDKCLQVSPGQPVIWYAYPVADAGADDTTCGYTYALDASPSPGKWELVDGQGTATFADDESRTSAVTVSAVGDYTFRWIANNHGCRDTSEVTITFVGDLALLKRTIECSQDKSEYRYEVEVGGGTGTYVVDATAGVPGTVNGNTILTEWMNAEEDSVLVIYDDMGCGPLVINLVAECDCESEVGTMVIDGILTACEIDGCIQVTYDSDGEFLDDNDSYMYVLHTIAGSNFGDVLMTNQTGEFCFGAPLQAGVTYYVSYVVGNELGSGDVDLTDQCLAIAGYQEVLFYEQPVADIMDDATSCSESFMLVANPSVGSGEWTLLSKPAGSGAVVIEEATQANTRVITDGTPGEYCFQWEETNGECSDAASVCVEIYDSPVVTNVQHICNSDGKTYYVEFTIEGGDPATYVVEGDAGTLNGDFFTSDPVLNDSTYVFYVFDGNACDTVVVTDFHECDCIGKAGNITVDDDHLCEDEILVVNYSGNISAADSDVNEFILKDVNGNIVQRNTNGEFSFDESRMNLGQGYNVRAYIGFPDGGGVDLLDECLDSSNAVFVTWHAYPVVIITSDEDMITCTVQEIMLDASGSTPQTGVTYSWEALENGSIRAGDESSPRPRITSGGLYRVTITHTLSGCTGEGEIRIDQSDDVPEIIIEPYGKLTCAVTTIQIDASRSTQGPTIETSWEDPAGNIIPGATGYTLDVTEPGVYIFTLRDTESNCEISKTIEVKEDTEAPIARASVSDMLGCSIVEVTLSGSGSSSGSMYSYTWSTTDGNLIGSVNNIDARASAAGFYTLTVTNNENGCTSTAEVEVRDNPNQLTRVSVTVSGLECEGGSLGVIQAQALDGTAPYIYRLSNGESNSTGRFTDLEPGEYTLEVEDAIGCLYSEIIELDDPSAFDAVFIDDIRINEGESAVIYFASIMGNVSEIIWEVDGEYTCLSTGPVCDSILVSNIESQVIVATLISDKGCVIERFIQVIVMKDRSVYIPTSFTPNNDGINDYFTIGLSKKVQEITELEIFNRWGNRVYSISDIPVTGKEIDTWDGRFKEELQGPGVYMYRMNVLFEDGEVFQYRGDVTLLR